jgi:hypothetical protein
MVRSTEHVSPQCAFSSSSLFDLVLLRPRYILNTLFSKKPSKESYKMPNKDHRWKYIGLVVRFIQAERLAVRAGRDVNVS